MRALALWLVAVCVADDTTDETAAAPSLSDWVGPACFAQSQWLLCAAWRCLLTPSTCLVCPPGTIRSRRSLRCWMGPPLSRRALQTPSPMATPPSTVRGTAPSGVQVVRWGLGASHAPPGVLRVMLQEPLLVEAPAWQTNSLPLPETF